MSWPDHSFSVKLAIRYGTDVAIAVHSFQLWIATNRANRRHFHDNHWWCYNTFEAFREWWPYWSPAKIRRVLEEMTGKTGILLKGNFSREEGRSSWDRTCWYAFADEEKFLPPTVLRSSEQPICENPQMHLRNPADGFAEISK